MAPDPNAKSQRRQAAKVQQGNPDRSHHVEMLLTGTTASSSSTKQPDAAWVTALEQII